MTEKQNQKENIVYSTQYVFIAIYAQDLKKCTFIGAIMGGGG